MNFFKELIHFGFSDLGSLKIFDTPKQEKLQKDIDKPMDINELLYDKTFCCPVCGKTFTSKRVKQGKNKIIKSDTDLKAYYQYLDPSLYEIIHCNCGYTALADAFPSLLPKQIEWIKETVCDKYTPQPIKEIRSVEDAITLYKLALLNTIVKKGKFGERGLICLKIAWLYRDLKNEEQEKIFLEQALKGLTTALEKESFPVFYIDENTATFIVAEIYHRLDMDADAMRWLSYLIFSGKPSSKLRQRAEDLKQAIKQKQKV